MIGVDSTFVIDYLNGVSEAVKTLEKKDEPLAITPISIFEVFVGLFLKDRSEQEKQIAQEFLDSFDLLAITNSSVIQAARIQANLIRKGNKAQPTDVLIAATFAAHSCTKILTRDAGFSRFGLEVLKY